MNVAYDSRGFLISLGSNCGDIPNTIGITGTPYIDGSTNIMYFFSKGYKNGAPTGSGTLKGTPRRLLPIIYLSHC
jgi:hypothetical protein